MKKRIVFVISTVCALSLVWCRNKSEPIMQIRNILIPGAPKIVLDGQNYLAKELVIVNELPEGYSYAGELTDQEKEFADINGKKYYLPDGAESIEDFYVYQECGTPVSEHLVDSAKRQWAYVKWSLEQS